MPQASMVTKKLKQDELVWGKSIDTARAAGRSSV